MDTFTSRWETPTTIIYSPPSTQYVRVDTKIRDVPRSPRRKDYLPAGVRHGVTGRQRLRRTTTTGCRRIDSELGTFPPAVRRRVRSVSSLGARPQSRLFGSIALLHVCHHMCRSSLPIDLQLVGFCTCMVGFELGFRGEATQCFGALLPGNPTVQFGCLVSGKMMAAGAG